MPLLSRSLLGLTATGLSVSQTHGGGEARVCVPTVRGLDSCRHWFWPLSTLLPVQLSYLFHVDGSVLTRFCLPSILLPPPSPPLAAARCISLCSLLYVPLFHDVFISGRYISLCSLLYSSLFAVFLSFTLTQFQDHLQLHNL